MADVIVVGGGVAGLTTGMLLAGDGHRVRLLERDPEVPPAPEDAWGAWTRKGVNQFRLLHYFVARFRKELEAELPAAAKALDDAGALRLNPVEDAPDELTGGHREGDEAFESVTGRRPVVESALSAAAAATPGLEVRRGVGIAGLLVDGSRNGGAPHVTGVRTEDGEDLTADLVVDVGGRRSALPRWFDAIGARPVVEEVEDSGFVYYGRHFRSPDGSLPPALTSLLSDYGSVSILTLPADHGTWGVGVIASAGDAALRGLRDGERWDATVRQFPLIAHWLDGEPLEDDVTVMAKIEDRIRQYVVDGEPVATGVLSVADAWACTNPSLGRGASIGLMHAVALRDLLRSAGTDDRRGLALAWDEATKATVEPWYRATLFYDRHRLAEAEAAARGEQYDPGDPAWELTKALLASAFKDPDLLRAYVSVVSVLRLPDDVMADPGVLDKVISLGSGWRDEPFFGPSRDELVKLAGG